MLNLISSLDLWLAGKHQHCVCFSAPGRATLGEPRFKQQQQATQKVVSRIIMMAEFEASHCEMCAWAETVNTVGHPQIPTE